MSLTAKHAIVLLVSVFLQVSVCEIQTGPSHNKVVVCYISSWAVYRQGPGSFAIENLDPSLCTHLIYSFAGLNVKEDSIRTLDAWQDLTDDYGKGGYKRITNLKNKYPHLKVSLAIGGWNEGSANYSKMAASVNRRARFVASAVDFVKKYNFDGLDLDWEYPGKRGGSPDDKLNFLLLVKELKAAFRKHNLLLTAAFGAGKEIIDTAYDVKGLSVYLDYFHMMCYDYHGAWDQKVGPNAPLRSSDAFSVEFTIDYMLKLGAPANKLVMGIPLYGRTYILNSTSEKHVRFGDPAEGIGFLGPITKQNGFMGYNEICLELKNQTWKTHWDSQSQTPYAVSGLKVIAYDNEQSIAEKVHFLVEKNLAGAMVWSVDTDDFRGDCSEDRDNFPLMRCINKSIVKSLEEIENAVVHGHDPRGGGGERVTSELGVAVIGVSVSVFMIYFVRRD